MKCFSIFRRCTYIKRVFIHLAFFFLHLVVFVLLYICVCMYLFTVRPMTRKNSWINIFFRILIEFFHIQFSFVVVVVACYYALCYCCISILFDKSKRKKTIFDLWLQNNRKKPKPEYAITCVSVAFKNMFCL